MKNFQNEDCIRSLVFGCSCLPIEDESKSQPANENKLLNLEHHPVEQHHRERRATCNLSIGTRTACNTHCRFKKYKRGYCNKICVCTNK
ncbi:defensin-like [Pogonomyrmex barbatus]|uniref:Defensin-like n=1 Tax=Pogonomyrmex barbatus TaxID=144034 RepID=A0A6I9X259_9HYME|nr:defensin-like [Pogonomyrmex barbatus]